MTVPNYDNYSSHELHEALQTIDQETFPERAALIRDKIKNLENANGKRRDGQEVRLTVTEPLGRQIDLERYLRFYKQGAPLLYLISMLFGLSILTNYFVPIARFGYDLSFQLPGLQNLGENFLKVLLYTILISLHTCFVLGVVGSYLNKNIFKLLLAVCWGLLSIGFQVWQFKWWPAPQFDFAFSPSFDLFGLTIAFRLNFVSAFFFGWASALSPDLRDEISSTIR